MTFIKISVDDKGFRDWVEEVKSNFHIMVETMKDVAEIVKAETLPRTPFETGRLGESFRYTVLTDNSKQKVIQIQMTALNPRTGYDYALIQHENPLPPRAPYHHVYGGSHFLLKGIQASEDMSMKIIEQDYLSLFNGFREVD